MNAIAIITARGGSKRIPRKNIRSFLGKPIIAYSIEVALNSGLFSEVMVSTDDEKIAETAKKYGAQVPFMRSAKNSDDFSGTLDVILEVLECYEKFGRSYNIGCCIYPTAPFITTQLLKDSLSILKNRNYDCVFPVVKYSYPIQRALRIDSQYRVSLFYPENLNKRSQDLEPAYHDAGQFYWFNSSVIRQKQALWTDNCGCIVIPETLAQDIDSEEDWKLAEIKFLHRHYGDALIAKSPPQ